MVDGTLSIRRREPKASEAYSQEAEKEALRHGTYEFFATGMLGDIGMGHLKQPKKANKPVGVPGEALVNATRKKKLRDYDKYLKNFKYSAALDSVLRKASTISFLPFVRPVINIDIASATYCHFLPDSGACSP